MLRPLSTAVLALVALLPAARLESQSQPSSPTAPQSPRAPVRPLRVLRVEPTGDAAPTATVSVTFDRPVAGSLDYTVAAKSIVHIEPAIAGKIEWRDPITVTVTPRAPLVSGARYVVSVSTDFHAMDGSRLAEPYRFTFRVRGPTLLAGSPAGAGESARFVTPRTRFELVWSAPVDLARLSTVAYLQFASTCSGERVVRLTADAQRRVRKEDGWGYREAGGYERDRRADSLRRVVTLTPAAPLPHGCAGELVAPAELDEGLSRGLVRWSFSTYGDLAVKGAQCPGKFCPTGPLAIAFTTPVRGAEVARRIRILPETPFTVRDTASESDVWSLEAALKPRVTYAVVVDTALRDIFGQRLVGNPAAAAQTTGYAPSVNYPYGRLLVERAGFGTLAVQHVNLDTLVVVVAPVPDSLEAPFLRGSEWTWGDLWKKVSPAATTRRIPVPPGPDRPTVSGIKLPTPVGRRRPTLLAVKVSGPRPDSGRAEPRPNIALVQVTDLGVHAKIGAESGVVWVTGVADGRPRAAAAVTLYDYKGRIAATATTDAQGLATLTGFTGNVPSTGPREDQDAGDVEYSGFDGFVAVTLRDDRAVVGISQYDPDLSPWRFNVSGAWGSRRFPAAGAVFTERGIYRPGEQIFAKAIVRRGALGALAVPAAGDSLRWIFRGRDSGALKDTVVDLSSFGTADYTLAVPADAPLGSYQLAIMTKPRGGRWLDIAATSYRVAEYRPPEFLVDMSGDTSAARLPGDSVRAAVQARYLFGAPMGRAVVKWQAIQTPDYGWSMYDLPGLEGFLAGDADWWGEEEEGRPAETQVFASGIDTLDESGRRTLRVKLRTPPKGRAAQVTLSAAVSDVNRQTVGASTSFTVHPAAFYVAVKPTGKEYFWTAGKPQSLAVLAVRPGGARVAGVRIRGAVVRREWHQAHRERNGVAEVVGEWVSDTVARCTLTSAEEPVPCAFTPKSGGVYEVTLRARDAARREARTTLTRWATGGEGDEEWVPWSDESRFKMDVIADRARYAVGDTATVLLASPFTDSEAWVTIEREGVIEQRRMRLASGSTTLRIPITARLVPNVFVSALVARGRSAPPGRLDDPGRPTIRVGYAELRVTPEVKRLAVDVAPLAKEYRPGDTARVALAVRDSRGVGRRAEVTLWAVDEGVLALTGYRTPDPIDLVYQPRGLGLRLASDLVSVAPQIPEGEKGRREPGGGGGAASSDVLRSRFKSTAFFLGSVITDAGGRAVASAKLPDNLTTFKVMAVAVTAGDEYGSGASSLLVTRPLLARAALPRFVRAGDDFSAGAVVNKRAGGTPTVTVRARAEGAELRAPRPQTATLEAGRGREVRFPFRALPGDSATFRFDVASGRDADAVQTRVAVRPDFHPRAYTASGAVRDTATAEFILPADIDAERSTVRVSLGSSPLAVIRGAYQQLRVYPYQCSEQVTSAALPLLALYRARQSLGSGVVVLRGDPRREIESAVEVLSARQRTDGGIGYWGASDWTTPWLSAYAGLVLLDARAAGVAVSDSVLARLARYLTGDLHRAAAVTAMLTPVAPWYEHRRTRLSDQVASTDFLSRLGRPDVPAENQLLALAPQLGWEDRVRLAEVVARRGATSTARGLLAAAWGVVKLEGRRAVVPDSLLAPFYFFSRFRPTARLLSATLAVQPDHPLVGPLVETLVQQGRAELPWVRNTQDWGSTVSALAEFERRQRAGGARRVRVRAGRRVLLEATSRGAAAPRDSVAPLAGLLTDRADGYKALTLSVDAPDGGPGVAYYYITVSEIPRARPVTPSDSGIRVERWYERYDARTPVVGVVEGELVRVRLRIKVPNERQFVVLDDALPAGLEAVDLSLLTSILGPGAPPESSPPDGEEGEGQEAQGEEREWGWAYGSWESGWWSPFDHRELRDDRVVYFATRLWRGTYSATYVARATTPGVFVLPPTYAEEMYNPAVNGRTEGGVFTVTARK